MPRLTGPDPLLDDMSSTNLITLADENGTIAVVAPDLGGWLLRYARKVPRHGLVDALHFSQAVLDRYPREMYSGIPILFPLVGRNSARGREHYYEWQGNLYPMPQHGFARRSRWTIVHQTPTSLTLELTDNETTRVDYPFAFRHTLTYRLDQGRLAWEQVIENRSPQPLPFSTGFHPYFRVPFTPAGRRDGCFVEIPESRRLTPSASFEKFTARPFPDQNWSVQEDVADTLFLTDLKRRELILVDSESGLEAILNFEDAPQHRFVALWSRSVEEPFYCLEPWTALPNAFSRPKDRELILLEPQATFRAALWIELRPVA